MRDRAAAAQGGTRVALEGTPVTAG
jgi:hypothetical protein